MKRFNWFLVLSMALLALAALRTLLGQRSPSEPVPLDEAQLGI